MTASERSIREGPWCATCGFPSTERERTLDPDRPIIYCRRVETDTSVRCGRQLGTYHRPEADHAYRTFRWKVTTAHHHQHHPERDPVPFCHRCQELPQRLALTTPGTDTGATQAPGARTRKESRT